MANRPPADKVLVTGAEGAFGSALVARLEARGARVAGIDLAEPSRELARACDITDAAATRRAVAELAGQLGGIDALVNVAGIGSAWPVSEAPSGYELQAIDVNLVGTWNVTAAALPWLLESQRGRLVNVASLLAVVTLPWLAAYSASKRGMCALGDAVRAEHRADGLRVTTVYPGYVATPIHEHGEARSGTSLHGLVPEETVEQVVRTLERALQRPRRDMATSLEGAIALRLARHAPGLLDRAVARRMRRRGLRRPAAFPSVELESRPRVQR